MKTRITIFLSALFSFTLLLTAVTAQADPVSTAFTYQGRLNLSGTPVTGNVDLQFYLYDAETAGALVGGGLEYLAVAVENGVFTLLLDWGAANFAGDGRWLEIHVRNPNDPDNPDQYVPLDPRQRLTVVPYAIHALNGGGSGGSGFWAANGNNISNTNSGFVGIGRSQPMYPAEIFGIESTVDGMTGMYIRANAGNGGAPLYGYRNLYFEAYHYLDPLGTWELYNSGNSMYFNILGNLGIGVNNFEDSKIAAAGVIESTSGGFKFPDGTIQTTAGGGSGGSGGEEFVMADSDLNNTVQLLASTTGPGTAAGPVMRLYNTLGVRTFTLFGGNQSGSTLDMDQSDGGPGLKLRAQSGLGLENGAVIQMYKFDGTNSLSLYADYNDSGQSRVVTDVVEITGGSDLSEQFDVAGGTVAVSPGSVVSIDPASPGNLRLSAQAYDRKVAGIISGADGIKPGLLMGQSGSVADGKHPVALTGRVYCKVDASFGAVEVGDLLTTSPTPGHAMKVGDYGQAQGAILGKAMTNLSSGQGMVLVLVTLQ